MRTLFIRHDAASDPGLVGRELEARGADVEVLVVSDRLDDATFHGPFPAADEFDLVVPLGAIWAVYDTATVGSWLGRELDLLRDADRKGIPVLGICFGGQALAAAHGGTVAPAPMPEIGWTQVHTDDPDLVPAGPWMQWHTDRFTVPPGALEIARNDAGPQAFRLRRNLGVQFHPEVDEEIIMRWLELSGPSAAQLLTATTGQTVDELVDETRRQADRAAADVVRLLDTFLDEVVTA